MNLDRIASKYIRKAESVLSELKIREDERTVKPDDVLEIVEEASRYLRDAKFYFSKGQYDVSLASIAYCEGLLDALRLLRLVSFEW